jgi:hypothetical protein
MITEQQFKNRALALLASFFVILFIIFMPIYHGQTGLNSMDTMFNALSKGSANFLEEQRQSTLPYAEEQLDQTLTLGSPRQAAVAAALITGSGGEAEVQGNELRLRIGVQALMTSMFDDCEAMYHNNATPMETRYQLDARPAMYGWWQLLEAMQKELNKNKRFELAKVMATSQAKAVEPAYNYFGVEPRSIRSSVPVIVLALGFYVVYTVWYGFGLLYLFEGLGIKLEH